MTTCLVLGQVPLTIQKDGRIQETNWSPTFPQWFILRHQTVMHFINTHPCWFKRPTISGWKMLLSVMNGKSPNGRRFRFNVCESIVMRQIWPCCGKQTNMVSILISIMFPGMRSEFQWEWTSIFNLNIATK